MPERHFGLEYPAGVRHLLGRERTGNSHRDIFGTGQVLLLWKGN